MRLAKDIFSFKSNDLLPEIRELTLQVVFKIKGYSYSSLISSVLYLSADHNMVGVVYQSYF